MRRFGFALILLVSLSGLTGCMISTQVGEQGHVNSPAPDEITFHFDTSFNRSLLYGRTIALLGLAGWFFRTRDANSTIVPLALAGVCAAAGIGWFVVGQNKLSNYRIDLTPAGMNLQLPSQPSKLIEWGRIESIDGEGVASSVAFGDGKGQALHWSTEWRELTIHLDDKSKVDLNLKPLSMEQRGTLWRAVARFAELETQTWVEPQPS